MENRVKIFYYKKIKQLIKEKHFYNRATLIQLINLSKPYPIERLSAAKFEDGQECRE